MPRAAKPTAKKHGSGGFAASTLALVLLWAVTAAAVVGAYLIRPAGPVSLTVVTSDVGFDVLHGSPQLLLGDAELESLTVAAFDTVTVTPRSPGAAVAALPLSGAGAASLTVKPARLETVTAPGDAHVAVNWSADEPDAAKLTVSTQPVHGSLKVPDGATLACHGCASAPDAKDISSIEWTGRSTGGGTTMLLRRNLATTLRLSQDDIAVQGALDTAMLSGEQRVSAIKEGSLKFLSVDRTEALGVGSRLIVEEIEPGSGRLKDLSVTKDGIKVTLEAKVGRLGMVEAGQFANRLPSWLELGFRQQGWLYLTQGVLLAGGTATKLLAWLRQRGGKDGGDK